jgi:hypothetical protein
MVIIFSADWIIYNYTLNNRNSTIVTQTIISHLKQLNTKETVTYVGVNQGSSFGQTCIKHPIDTINIHVYTTHIHNQYICIYHPIETINIHVYTTHIHNQYTWTYHPYPQSIYMCISPHRRNQYTCIYHPYKQSIYMYIPPIYTINIHVYTTHIHNQYTCIYHPYTQSIYKRQIISLQKWQIFFVSNCFHAN